MQIVPLNSTQSRRTGDCHAVAGLLPSENKRSNTTRVIGANVTLPLALLPSIHVLAPLEEGGSVARTGFLYQDHVAARYCIQMLRDPSLVEVWCETEDDITLVWQTADGPVVEMIQVKANELKQLWSIALLCDGLSKSILAKSLAHDRCCEPCLFRLVTRGDIHPELHPLRLERGDPRRCLGNPEVRKLHREVLASLGDLLSPRRRSVSHWLGDAVWDAGDGEDAIVAKNRWQLHEHLETINEFLFPDQHRELYERLLRRVQQAAFPKWKGGAELKKLRRVPFQEWFQDTIYQVRGYAPTRGGVNVKRKMRDALIPNGQIENADRLRREFRMRQTEPKYQLDDDAKSAEIEVVATLQHLLSDLDAGNIIDDGVRFHARCLGALQSVNEAFPGVRTSFLQGAMYTATDRCRHRFLPVRP